MATAPIMLGAGILQSVLGGIFGNKAATELAAGQINAANNANSIRDNQYQLNRADLAPYSQTGQAAITTLGSLLGIGPKPGSAPQPGSTTLPADAQNKKNKLDFLQAWLAGQNPVGANGQHIGGAPHNAATIAKVQGEIDQLKRDVTTAQQIADDQARQQGLINQQDPNAYGSLMKDFTLADFNADPGYNFRLQEGAKTLQRSAAAKGGLFSGGTLKNLDQYNQNFASNEFTNSYNRYQNNRLTKYNLLAGTAGLGQASTSQLANLGAQNANQIADTTQGAMENAATIRASQYANTANMLNGIIGAGTQFALSKWGNQSQGSPSSVGQYGNSGGGGIGSLSNPFPRIPGVIVN